MSQFVVCQHHHYGWTKNTHEAATEKDAMLADILKYHDWLPNYSHQVEFKEGRYAVTYTGENRSLPLGRIQRNGDRWFSDQIRIGAAGDCVACGGTGVNHYNPFVQCWKCGDKTQRGVGAGKMKCESA